MQVLHLGSDSRAIEPQARQMRLANLIAMHNSLDRESSWAIELQAEIADEFAATSPNLDFKEI